MEDWRAAKESWAARSDSALRETVMSTMEPEIMVFGRRIDGNSICAKIIVSSSFSQQAVSGGLPVVCLQLEGQRRLRRPYPRSEKLTW